MTYQNENPGHGSRVTGHGDEINLLDYWRVIMRHKKMIAGIVLFVSILAVVVSFLMPKTFKAEAVIVPVSSKSGGGLSALASQFGGLAQMAGVNIPAAGSDTEKFMAILKSRTLSENVINRENLMPVLYEKAWDAKAGKWKTDDPKRQPTMEDAVKKIKMLVTSMDDKKSKTIKIVGEFGDPKLAASVVNAYVDELQKFINANSFTMAKRNRIFIEDQLAQNKEELLEAGKEINEFYRGNRISSSDAKVDVPVESGPVARGREAGSEQGTRNQESGKTVASLDAPDSKPAVADPEAQTDAPSALNALAAQKSDLEKKIAEARTVKNVPQQVYLTYLMLRRELLAKVNALLTSQYEMAKIEEAKEDLAFQVIDNAVPPVRKYSPKRGQICIMSFMAAIFLSIFFAFFRDYLAKMKAMDRSRQISPA